jgi:hypothetical protein
MLQIWKYPFHIESTISVSTHKSAKILMIDCQQNVPCIWMLVDPSSEKVTRRLKLVGTGHEIDVQETSYILGQTRHVGSFQQGVFVWHVFDQGEI